MAIASGNLAGIIPTPPLYSSAGGAIIDLAWCITPELVPFPIGQTFSFVVPRRCRKVQQGGMWSGSVVLALECNCIP